MASIQANTHTRSLRSGTMDTRNWKFVHLNETWILFIFNRCPSFNANTAHKWIFSEQIVDKRLSSVKNNAINGQTAGGLVHLFGNFSVEISFMCMHVLTNINNDCPYFSQQFFCQTVLFGRFTETARCLLKGQQNVKIFTPLLAHHIL